MAEYIDRVISYGTTEYREEDKKLNRIGNYETNNQNVRKIICRYGRGCTHLHDLQHRDQFWHPPINDVNDEQRRSHYICNECGFATPSLQELQLHLKRKTAWSNSSLVGCRISCLIDAREWHEGYVSQYHRSGKHYVEFRTIGEKRWLCMKKIAFYIVERPCFHASDSQSEFKEGELHYDENNDLAPLEDNWVYVEDVSLEYTFSQSVLFKMYGSMVQETGHKTKGHICLTESDRTTAQQMKGSLLYGELLPRGVNKALGYSKLCAQEASVLYDLGSGTGKVAVQAFLQFRNLTYVYGIELSLGRYSIAEDAVLRMVDLLGRDNFNVDFRSGSYIQVTEAAENGVRVLRLECGDMFETTDMHIADIVMLETDVPAHLQPNLCQLLSSMHEGSRALTYLDLRKLWISTNAPFKQMESNKNLSDRFPTSWSVQRGHHFFLWQKISLDCRPTVSTESTTYTRSTSNCAELERKHQSISSSNTTSSESVGCFPVSLRRLLGLRALRATDRDSRDFMNSSNGPVMQSSRVQTRELSEICLVRIPRLGAEESSI